jgi:hypothetical protein
VLDFFGAILVSCLVMCGILNHAGVAYFIVMAGGGIYGSPGKRAVACPYGCPGELLEDCACAFRD